MSAEELMRLRCDTPRCKGSITWPRTTSEPAGIRAAAAASGWTTVSGAASLAHRLITRDLKTQDRCAACNHRQPVAFEGTCVHCGGMGAIGRSGCVGCDRSEAPLAADSRKG